MKPLSELGATVEIRSIQELRMSLHNEEGWGFGTPLATGRFAFHRP